MPEQTTPENRLIIFFKAPRPGAVKTRLARTLGPDSACEAYRAIVQRLLENLRPLAGVVLCYTPDDSADEIKPWLNGDWTSLPQGDGDLGARLHAAFHHAFLDGAERVAIIGSDCPDVTPQDIRDAWSALERHDVVLGPATDGGYWLIALSRARLELFSDVPWSTPDVLRETLRRIQSNRLSVHLLRELSDVDDDEDWRAFVAQHSGR